MNSDIESADIRPCMINSRVNIEFV